MILFSGSSVVAVVVVVAIVVVAVVAITPRTKTRQRFSSIFSTMMTRLEQELQAEIRLECFPGKAPRSCLSAEIFSQKPNSAKFENKRKIRIETLVE